MPKNKPKINWNVVGWVVVALLIPVIGGIVGFLVNRKKDPDDATVYLICGFFNLLGLFVLLIYFILIKKLK